MKTLLSAALILLTACCAAARTGRVQPPKCGFYYSKVAMAREKLVLFFDTLRFAPGEHIAEVGAQGGNLAGMISLMYHDIDYTLEDIDSSCLTDRQVAAVLRYYSVLNDSIPPDRIRCHVVIGNDSSTTLPDAAYRKVFFINTYHEVTKPAQMLTDIYRILAPGGTLYAQEGVTQKKRLRRKDCGHLMPVESELLKAFADAGFRLVKSNISERHRRKGDWVTWRWYQFAKG